MPTPQETVSFVLSRALDDHSTIMIEAELPITKSEDGHRYVIDVEGKDDMIVGGETLEEAIGEAMEALCDWADDSIANGRRHADLAGVTHRIVPARQWARSAGADLVPA